MPSQTIQWFPGHMAKTRRMITENLSDVDIVLELLDARIPYSSKNPEIRKLVDTKPILTLLNKSSLANQEITNKWITFYKNNGMNILAIDCVTGEGINKLQSTIKEILKDKIKRYEEKGMKGRQLKAMIVGIPNVGKSSLINKIAGNKKAKVENRPGVTLDKQWVPTSIGITLLDMPGVLWPKFEDQNVGIKLAATGAIKDAIIDTETLATKLVDILRTIAQDKLCARYKLDADAIKDLEPYDLLELIGRKRGCIVSGGEVDTERAALLVLEEFRSAKIGNITLEVPEK